MENRMRTQEEPLSRKVERLKLMKAILLERQEKEKKARDRTSSEVLSSLLRTSSTTSHNKLDKILGKISKMKDKQKDLKGPYNKCLEIVLDCMRETLHEFLTVPEDSSDMADYTDTTQKEQYKPYGLLLSACNIKQLKLSKEKSQQMTQRVIKSVTSRHHLSASGQKTIEDYVTKTVTLSRTMLTLLPPTVVFYSLYYNEPLHDTNRASWDEDRENKPHLRVTHYRPVLLYGNRLHVAVKGLVGNARQSNTPPLSLHRPSLQTTHPSLSLPPSVPSHTTSIKPHPSPVQSLPPSIPSHPSPSSFPHPTTNTTNTSLKANEAKDKLKGFFSDSKPPHQSLPSKQPMTCEVTPSKQQKHDDLTSSQQQAKQTKKIDSKYNTPQSSNNNNQSSVGTNDQHTHRKPAPSSSTTNPPPPPPPPTTTTTTTTTTITITNTSVHNTPPPAHHKETVTKGTKVDNKGASPVRSPIPGNDVTKPLPRNLYLPNPQVPETRKLPDPLTSTAKKTQTTQVIKTEQQKGTSKDNSTSSTTVKHSTPNSTNSPQQPLTTDSLHVFREAVEKSKLTVRQTGEEIQTQNPKTKRPSATENLKDQYSSTGVMSQPTARPNTNNSQECHLSTTAHRSVTDTIHHSIQSQSNKPPNATTTSSKQTPSPRETQRQQQKDTKRSQQTSVAMRDTSYSTAFKDPSIQPQSTKLSYKRTPSPRATTKQQRKDTTTSQQVSVATRDTSYLTALKALPMHIQPPTGAPPTNQPWKTKFVIPSSASNESKQHTDKQYTPRTPTKRPSLDPPQGGPPFKVTPSAPVSNDKRHSERRPPTPKNSRSSPVPAAVKKQKGHLSSIKTSPQTGSQKDLRSSSRPKMTVRDKPLVTKSDSISTQKKSGQQQYSSTQLTNRDKDRIVLHSKPSATNKSRPIITRPKLSPPGSPVTSSQLTGSAERKITNTLTAISKTKLESHKLVHADETGDYVLKEERGGGALKREQKLPPLLPDKYKHSSIRANNPKSNPPSCPPKRGRTPKRGNDRSSESSYGRYISGTDGLDRATKAKTHNC